MTEAPKRIWADGKPVCGSWSVGKDFDDDVEYIRADLVEAAIKRALDAAASREFIGDAEICTIDPRIAADIRDLIPAQFIDEGEKE